MSEGPGPLWTYMWLRPWIVRTLQHEKSENLLCNIFKLNKIWYTGENGNSQEDSFNIIKGFLYISKKKRGFLYNLKFFSDGFIGFQNIIFLDENFNAMTKTFKLRVEATCVKMFHISLLGYSKRASNSMRCLMLVMLPSQNCKGECERGNHLSYKFCMVHSTNNWHWLELFEVIPGKKNMGFYGIKFHRSF